MITANPITLFAPTNDAFDFLPSRIKDILESARKYLKCI